MLGSGPSTATTMAALEELVPRAYQTEIFEKARKENIICAMDTGSGKVRLGMLSGILLDYTDGRRLTC